MHRIADVAKLAGVSPSTLRLWEQHGLLKPERSDAGQRMYTDKHVELARLIKHMREVDGLNVPAIRRALGVSQVKSARNGIEPAPKKLANSTGVTDQLGERYRLARVAFGLSLRKVAERTGLPISFLSTFERTSKGATVASLQAMANCYGLTVTELAGRTTRPRGRQRDIVVRGGAERLLPAFGEGIQTLQLAETLTLLDCQKWVLNPGAQSHGSYAHDGEEFIHVLAGEFIVVLEGRDEYHLTAGDSIAFPSSRPHAWIAVGSDQTVLIWINTPKSF